MPAFLLRADGRLDGALDQPVDLTDEAHAERVAIQMLAELRLNAGVALDAGVTHIAVHHADGRFVMDVSLKVVRTAP
jgi:hypothetical protein